jgi:hypothetical protein
MKPFYTGEVVYRKEIIRIARKGVVFDRKD